MTRRWQRDTCYCGASMYLYEGSDGTFWVHDKPQHPHHMAELTPPALADVADLANDEFERFVRNRPLDPAEDSLWYGEPLSGWEVDL